LRLQLRNNSALRVEVFMHSKLQNCYKFGCWTLAMAWW